MPGSPNNASVDLPALLLVDPARAGARPLDSKQIFKTKHEVTSRYEESWGGIYRYGGTVIKLFGGPVDDDLLSKLNALIAIGVAHLSNRDHRCIAAAPRLLVCLDEGGRPGKTVGYSMPYVQGHYWTYSVADGGISPEDPFQNWLIRARALLGLVHQLQVRRLFHGDLQFTNLKLDPTDTKNRKIVGVGLVDFDEAWSDAAHPSSELKVHYDALGRSRPTDRRENLFCPEIFVRRNVDPQSWEVAGALVAAAQLLLRMPTPKFALANDERGIRDGKKSIDQLALNARYRRKSEIEAEVEQFATDILRHINKGQLHEPNADEALLAAIVTVDSFLRRVSPSEPHVIFDRATDPLQPDQLVVTPLVPGVRHTPEPNRHAALATPPPLPPPPLPPPLPPPPLPPPPNSVPSILSFHRLSPILSPRPGLIPRPAPPSPQISPPLPLQPKVEPTRPDEPPTKRQSRRALDPPRPAPTPPRPSKVAPKLSFPPPPITNAGFAPPPPALVKPNPVSAPPDTDPPPALRRPSLGPSQPPAAVTPRATAIPTPEALPPSSSKMFDPSLHTSVGFQPADVAQDPPTDSLPLPVPLAGSLRLPVPLADPLGLPVGLRTVPDPGGGEPSEQAVVPPTPPLRSRRRLIVGLAIAAASMAVGSGLIVNSVTKAQPGASGKDVVAASTGPDVSAAADSGAPAEDDAGKPPSVTPSPTGSGSGTQDE
jgi:hypothetical protein